MKRLLDPKGVATHKLRSTVTGLGRYRKDFISSAPRGHSFIHSSIHSFVRSFTDRLCCSPWEGVPQGMCEEMPALSLVLVVGLAPSCCSPAMDEEAPGSWFQDLPRDGAIGNKACGWRSDPRV